MIRLALFTKYLTLQALSLVNRSREYMLSAEVRDLNGTGTNYDRATVTINVQSVNQHKPRFIVPSLSNATIRIPENSKDDDHLVLVLKAEDADPGDNGRVSYHIRVGEQLVEETPEFKLHPASGELRTRLKLDREAQASFELLLVAKDQGGPSSSYETLRLLTVIVDDENDNQLSADLKSHRISSVLKRTSVLTRLLDKSRLLTSTREITPKFTITSYPVMNENVFILTGHGHGFVYNRVVLDRVALTIWLSRQPMIISI